MATYRRYTAKQKAEAVGIGVVEGVTRAAEQSGIPKVTVWQWMQKAEYEQLRTNARDKVGEWLWVGMQIGIKELIVGVTGEAPLNHKADAFRALADRYALLMGEATMRSESRDITGSLSDADIIGAVRAASDHIAASAGRARSETPDPSEG